MACKRHKIPVVERRARQWFITCGGIENYASIRTDFLSYFEGVEEYCVSIEANHTNKLVHVHSYLKFYDYVTFDYVKQCVPSVGTVNVQHCKSRRNVLKYITKEDETPFFNCSASELSFAYRARSWAKRTPTFRYFDPFVLEYPQYYRLLSELHKEVCDRRRYRQPNVPTLQTWYPGWAMCMYESLIRVLRRQTTRQLYIFGPSGTGKTFTLSLLLRDLELWRCYMPVPGQFFFGDFTASAYDVVLFEEFDFDLFKHNFSQIKRLLNAERFSVDVKGSRQRILAVRCPVIFVSNYEPPNDRAFIRRVQVINALEEMETKDRVPIPKEEVDSPETWIEISDTEDEISEGEEVSPSLSQASTVPAHSPSPQTFAI